VEKVAAGISGQAHFGKTHYLHLRSCSLSHEGHRLFNVVGTIRYFKQGDGRSHPDKSVVHGRWFYRHKCTFLCQQTATLFQISRIHFIKGAQLITVDVEHGNHLTFLEDGHDDF